jgi:5-methylcytosine-specific restriction protein A
VVTRRYDYDRSDAANAYRAWYGTQRWRKLAKAHLASEPLCRMCLAEGLVQVARVCDHIQPHRGDEISFWSGPFQSLCSAHHDREKKDMEAGRGPRDVASDGWPVGSP